MKTMTCKQLGGACDHKFYADTFEEIAELSKKHAAEMLEKGDKAHMEAMREMRGLMLSPENMQHWFANKRKEFADLPDHT
ncbi:DUF1059 domain-containing protein [Pseudozobellia thermophila]|uniref:DUF1059 domain-containing protein n=1 Tax=Pseudozobellia thermophila TaxID=192903 RepID=A0A1M6ADY9_9FLAO|nr:DUF1059 domain-containing protein [Pseudozobellia thermophila]SHI34403.1 hypothetical protein SAMN04488513_10116 [Pseudozobellia thermophila]